MDEESPTSSANRAIKAANDNKPIVQDNWPDTMLIVEGEVDIIETYLGDVVGNMVASNDN